MSGVRVVFAFLVALQLGLWPVAAMAHAPATQEAAPAHPAAMEECEHAHGGAHHGEDSVPSKSSTCTLACCLMKCFERFVETPRVKLPATPVAVIYAAVSDVIPAAQQYTPQPPPPRS